MSTITDTSKQTSSTIPGESSSWNTVFGSSNSSTGNSNTSSTGNSNTSSTGNSNTTPSGNSNSSSNSSSTSSNSSTQSTNPLANLIPSVSYDWNPNNCSIELIIVMVLVNIGMSPLEQSMENVVNQQNIQDKVDTDMIQLSGILSDIESAATAKGATVQGLQAQLQTSLQNLFGGSSSEETLNGQTYIVPSSNSDVGQFITMLQQKNANDPSY